VWFSGNLAVLLRKGDVLFARSQVQIDSFATCGAFAASPMILHNLPEIRFPLYLQSLKVAIWGAVSRLGWPSAKDLS
jgi:hypothetical protein